MRVCLILLALLVAAPMATAQFVFPPINATTEGGGDNSWPFRYTSNNGRYHQSYDATQFPAGGPITIKTIAFRTKSDSAKPAATADFRMTLSYCAVAWNALSSTFASNIGASPTVVFNGVWAIAAFPGDPGAPNPFYAVLTLTTPFVYDPKLGDMLMDIEMRQSCYPSTAGTFEFCASGTAMYRVFANGGLTAPTGSLGTYGLITEFNGGGCPTASWNNYPKGYPGTLGVPGLTLSANPVLGTTPTLLFTSSSPGNETSLLLYGFTKVIIPGFWGGYLLLSPIGVAVLPAPAPGYKIAIPIPNNPVLCGASVLMQVIQSDKGATPAQASSTAGLEMIIGT